MNVFKREVKANLKSLLVWSIIVIIFIFLGITEFSGYEGNPEMVEVINEMPDAFLEAFQMDAFNLTTITGFYGVMFTYFALMATISAAMWGSDIISKEERDKTVEFALSLPITREKLVTAKILAAVVNCIALLIVIWGASVTSALPYDPDSDFHKFLFLCMLALFMMQLVFLAIGVFLGCAIKQHKRAGSVAVSLLLVTYFMSVISGLSKGLEFLKYFTPFKYFDPVMMLNESRIDLGYVLLSFGIIIVCLAGGYFTYARRDLYI